MKTIAIEQAVEATVKSMNDQAETLRARHEHQKPGKSKAAIAPMEDPTAVAQEAAAKMASKTALEEASKRAGLPSETGTERAC